jgi:YD repeat-containing protein
LVEASDDVGSDGCAMRKALEANAVTLTALPNASNQLVSTVDPSSGVQRTLSYSPGGDLTQDVHAGGMTYGYGYNAAKPLGAANLRRRRGADGLFRFQSFRLHRATWEQNITRSGDGNADQAVLSCVTTRRRASTASISDNRGMEREPLQDAPSSIGAPAVDHAKAERERVVWNDERRAGFAELAAALREAYEALRAEGYELVDGILAPPPDEV